MGIIKVIPTVLVQKFSSGATITGVLPVESGIEFKFSGMASGPFTLGETISWTGGTGVLVRYMDDGDEAGSMVLGTLTGVKPAVGATLTGGTSSATASVYSNVESAWDSKQDIERGRYRRYSLLSNGGLIDIPETSGGFRVINILVGTPGITAIKLSVVDLDGNDVSAGDLTVTTGRAYHEFRNGGLLVPPGCKFKIEGTGILSAVGQIMVVLGHGWRADVFADSFEIGNMNTSPSI